jgi:hypothetical protein
MARIPSAPAIDDVEKVLLGATPADTLADPVPARLNAVRAYLDTQPALRAVLRRDFTKAWQAAGGSRAAFLSGVAEQRARVLSFAAAGAPRPQVQRAAADFQRELSRYLIAHEGAGADGAGV